MGHALCPHGLVGFCPDCPPTRHAAGDIRGVRSAQALGRMVRRFREDGSFDYFTQHFTKRGARRAAELYERTGKIKGMKP